MNKYFEIIEQGIDVSPLLKQIEENPQLWNEHTLRTDGYATPHAGVSDIWIRYRDIKEFTGDREAFIGKHDPVYYQGFYLLTEIKPLLDHVINLTKATEVGGILITRIDPHKEVAPHIDGGYNALHYDKYAVQLKASPGQVFYFEDQYLESKPGDLYKFRNDITHGVVNYSDHERMTLLISLR